MESFRCQRPFAERDIINRVSASEDNLLLSSPLSFDICCIGKISNCFGRIARANRAINESLILNCNNRERFVPSKARTQIKSILEIYSESSQGTLMAENTPSYYIRAVASVNSGHMFLNFNRDRWTLLDAVRRTTRSRVCTQLSKINWRRTRA